MSFASGETKAPPPNQFRCPGSDLSMECSYRGVARLASSDFPFPAARMSRTKDSYCLWEYLLTTRPGIGWFYGTAPLSGLLLQALIGLMLVCSCPFIRKSGHFEVRGPASTSPSLLILLGFRVTPGTREKNGVHQCSALEPMFSALAL